MVKTSLTPPVINKKTVPLGNGGGTFAKYTGHFPVKGVGRLKNAVFSVPKKAGGVSSYPFAFAFAIAALAAVQQNSRRQSLPHDTTTAAHQFHKLQLLLFHCYHSHRHMIGLRICVRVLVVNSASVRWSVAAKVYLYKRKC